MNAINHGNFSQGASALAIARAFTVIEGGKLETPVEIEPIAPAAEIVALPAEIVAPEPAPAEFTIGRAAIGKVIDALARVVEKRNTIPILSNVLLHASGGMLTATATDLDMEVMAIAECGDGEFSATLPAHMLQDILKKGADSNEVTFTMEPRHETVRLHWGKLSYRLNALPVADFPSLTSSEFSHNFELPGKALRNMLESTARAMSKEETLYYLNGVYFHTQEYGNRAELRVTATDGHRLYSCDVDMPEAAAGMAGAIVPRGAVELLLSLTKGKACPDIVTMAFSVATVDRPSMYCRFSFGDIEIVSKLVDGTYPDYQRVIPTGNDLVATFKAGEFLSALDSVSVVSSERGRAVKLMVEDGRAVFSVNNPDAGSSTMEIGATLAKHGEAAPCIEIGFNACYLKTMMKDLADDGDEIMVEFSDSGSPTIFKSGRDGFLAVLMPMRV